MIINFLVWPDIWLNEWDVIRKPVNNTVEVVIRRVSVTLGKMRQRW